MKIIFTKIAFKNIINVLVIVSKLNYSVLLFSVTLCFMFDSSVHYYLLIDLNEIGNGVHGKPLKLIEVFLVKSKHSPFYLHYLGSFLSSIQFSVL